MVEDILASIQQRADRHRSGIAVASDYVGTMDRVIGPDVEKHYGLGSLKLWRDTVKDANAKLVYRSDSVAITDTKRKGKKEDGTEETGLTPMSCMDFTNVLTSKRRDRDRDVLEPAGANIDPYMPLLWQHLPHHPVGKLIEVVEQTEEIVRTRFAIVDNVFGNDVALLVQFGALRISHGFIPTQWEPLEGEDGEGQGDGYHILAYDVLEGSVVSIPSNIDAAIESFSRGKLHHPMVKSWAQLAFTDRTKIVPVATPGVKKGANSMTVPATTPANPNIPPVAATTPVVNLTVNIDGKGKKGDEEGSEGEGEAAAPEVSEMASLGRVHLLIEQLGKVEGLPEEAMSICQQALAELSHCMNADAGDDGKEQPVDDGGGEEEEDEEGKEGEEDEDKDGEEEDEPKDPHQYVMEDEDAEEEKDEDEEEEKEQVAGEDEVEPGDSEGREDGKSLDDWLFQKSLKEAKPSKAPKKAPKSAPAKKPTKAPAKPAKAPQKPAKAPQKPAKQPAKVVKPAKAAK